MYSVSFLGQKSSKIKSLLNTVTNINSFKFCNIDNIYNEDNLIIIVSKSDDINKIPICENTVYVIHSKYKNIINEIIKYNVPIITIGMNKNDVVTFSSISEYEYIVSLQRDISVFGTIIEPQEISLSFTKQVDEDVVLYVSTLLFLNNNII